MKIRIPQCDSSSGAQLSGGARGRCVSHSARERVSTSAKRVDGAIPWRGDVLPEELPRLVKEAGALREEDEYQSVFA